MEEDFYNDIMKAICIISNIENDLYMDDINFVRNLVNLEYFVKNI